MTTHKSRRKAAESEPKVPDPAFYLLPIDPAPEDKPDTCPDNYYVLPQDANGWCIDGDGEVLTVTQEPPKCPDCGFIHKPEETEQP